MDPLTPNICGVCNVTEIFRRDYLTGRLLATPEYSEIYLALSNDTIASHGVCTHCIGILTDELVEILFERIRQSWWEELQTNGGSAAHFEDLKVLEVEAWHTQKEVALRTHQDKKEAQRQSVLQAQKK